MSKIKMRNPHLSIRPVIKYLKPYKKLFFWAVFFVVLENGIQLVLPIFYGKAIDVVMSEKNFSKQSLILVGSWFILSLLSEWFMRIRIRQGLRIGYKVATDMFTKYVYHLIRLPLDFHKKNKVGELIERFDRADGSVDRIINNELLQSIPHILTSCLAFFIIGWIKWELAIIYVFFITIFIFITIKKIKPIVAFNQKISQLYEKVYGGIFERVPNVATIKANTSEKKEHLKNLRQYDNIFTYFDSYNELWMKLQFWQHLIFSFGFLALFSFGLFLIKMGHITFGQFIMLLAYVNMASSSIRALGGNYKELQEGLININRAEKIYGFQEEPYDNSQAQPLKDCLGRIEFHKVNFSRNRKRILKDLSFKVKPGQLVAIVGRSGQGKTTLVDLLSRFGVPTSGKINLDGMDIQKIKLEDLRKHIGIVSQEIGLFHDTLKNNIRYSKSGARVEDVLNVARVAHCHEFIHKMPKKYDTLIGDKGVRLSVGQRQRVAIARAVLRDPKILILDEATSALDSESEKLVQEAMDEIMKNRTTFVIAHRLSTIRKADLILVLEDGEIVERGNHAELMRHGGVYKKLHEIQYSGV